MTAPIIENNYTGDGSTVLFSFTFEYIEATDIEVSIDNVTIATTEYSLANSTTIEFNTAPATGTAVRIYRNTTVNEPKATFFPGSAIRAQDLNDNFEQILFVTQEADAISERAETAADAAQTATTTAQAAAASANTAGAAAQASATAAQASATAAQTSATAAAADASQASTDAASAVATANTASTNASNAVTTANTASALISTAVLADGTRAMSGDLNVNSNKVVNLANPTAGGDAVNKSFADANYQPLDAELTELATMQNTTASALADLTQAEVLVLDGATLSTAELNTLDGITATTSELNALDGITSTVGELNVLDGVTATTTELNITDGLTASTAELNQLDGKTISNVLTPANNNDIPTSSAVNTYVSGLLNALGGFVAIANESSFPTTNPDPSDNAGTVVSITDAGGLVVDSSGNSTSATTTGNATVTITGFPSSLHSTTLGNDLGLQVQTTSTLNTYTYHKLIAKESDVVRLSDDINDFNERYRVSASAPTTDLDAGDLWFDTTAGKMKVYDANDSAWEEVQSVGNFFINTLSSSSGTGGGSATFNGSAYRFTLSNAGTTAQQMLVSINGVVQKPNSGTSQPSEGFAIDTNDIIFAAAPASSASYFIVTIGSSVNIGQPSNNTVDTSELVDGAVTNAKVSSSAAIAGTKISPDFGTQTVETDGNVYAAKIGVNTSSPRNISGFGSLAVDGTSGSLVDLFRNGTREGTAAVDSGGFKLEAVGSSTPLIGITNGAERMRIDSSGDVQARRARSNTTGDVALSVQPSDSSIHYGLRIDATNNSLNLDRASGTAANLLTVDSSGNVGIGTSSPNSFLHVDSDNTYGNVVLSRDGGAAGRRPFGIGISGSTDSNLRISASSNTSGANAFANQIIDITADGNVGLGTTSPTKKLHIDSSSDQIRLSDGSGGFELRAGNVFKISDDGTERVRIDSAGRVGINTTTFADGATGLVVKNGASGSEHTFLDMVCDTNESNRLRFSEDGSTFPGEIRYNTFGHELLFKVNSSERLRIQSGGGISFNGDGAAANALDDYEEGDWTPTVQVEGQNNATTDKQNGRYVKIGSKVTVWAYVQLNGTPSGRGVNNAWIHGGLPFPKRNDEGGFDIGGPIMYWSIDSTSALNGTAPYMLVARLFNNSSGGRIRGHDSSNNQSGQNLSLLLKDNTEYAYSFTYETTA